MEIVVPGRICLFGEHSDWAGGYRRINSEITPGQVIICGTNQGIHAKVKAIPESIIRLRSVCPDGREESTELALDRTALQSKAADGSFFSYAAGVAYYMLDFYDIGGLEIDNYLTTLPVKKGLSSSAAFSVLVARAFNQCYHLNLTVRAEIEAAYQGELMTPSRCGRMDQGCAYGQVPVGMSFDGELMTSKAIVPGTNFQFLIADLKAEKDTLKILADLNRAFPFPDTAQERLAQDYLGPINASIVSQAEAAITDGDAPRLGALMDRSQAEFDRCLMNLSSELQSPRLHDVIEDPAIRQWIYGTKGVGSQGDGCIQFLTKSAEARQALQAYLEATYNLDCFELDIDRPPLVRKAVIPVAGLGTRMYPFTKAFPKPMLPVVDRDGITKPAIQQIIEEVFDSGIEEILLIVQPGTEQIYREYFSEKPPAEVMEKLSEKQKKSVDTLKRISACLTITTQDEQLGFGHAVYQAKEWVGNEAFVLMLGDHLYQSGHTESCLKQVVGCFDRHNGEKSALGLYRETIDKIVHYGTLTGSWVDKARCELKVTRMIEKPTHDIAHEFLVTEHLNDFLCVIGIYIFTPAIFDILATLVAQRNDGDGEVQLTTAIQQQIRDDSVYGYLVDGTHFDVGLPDSYRHTVGNFGKT